jgi:hypothetical protein
MFRNLITLVLILMIIFGDYKLNNAECFIFYFLGLCYILGNFFITLKKNPKNAFWNFIITGGNYWHEYPVTIIIMLSLLVYAVLRKH